MRERPRLRFRCGVAAIVAAAACVAFALLRVGESNERFDRFGPPQESASNALLEAADLPVAAKGAAAEPNPVASTPFEAASAAPQSDAWVFRVVDVSGRAVAGAPIYFVGESERRLLEGRDRPTGISDDDGNLTVACDWPQDDLAVAALDGATTVAARRPSGETRKVELRFEARHRVVLRFADRAGLPVAGIPVAMALRGAWRPETEAKTIAPLGASRGGTTGVSDAEGRIELRGVADGTWWIMVHSDRHAVSAGDLFPSIREDVVLDFVVSPIYAAVARFDTAARESLRWSAETTADFDGVGDKRVFRPHPPVQAAMKRLETRFKDANIVQCFVPTGDVAGAGELSEYRVSVHAADGTTTSVGLRVRPVESITEPEVIEFRTRPGFMAAYATLEVVLSTPSGRRLGGVAATVRRSEAGAPPHTTSFIHETATTGVPLGLPAGTYDVSFEPKDLAALCDAPVEVVLGSAAVVVELKAKEELRLVRFVSRQVGEGFRTDGVRLEFDDGKRRIEVPNWDFAKVLPLPVGRWRAEWFQYGAESDSTTVIVDGSSVGVVEVEVRLKPLD